jgi:acyl-CoA dehydrogenase
MFISNGGRGDFYSVAVPTGGDGMAGSSLLLEERSGKGFSQSELLKGGGSASNTAVLHFDGVRVPASSVGTRVSRFFGNVKPCQSATEVCR